MPTSKRPGQRKTQDRHDPDLDRNWLDQQRRLRRFALAMGTRIRSLVGMAGGPGGSRPEERRGGRAAEDTAGEIVERVVEETEVEKQR